MPMLVLMPGMDGTGTLFSPLLHVLPADVQYTVISYPPDRICSYDELLQQLEDKLHDKGDLILVGESFSGPLAIRYAARHGTQVRALILCVSFVTSPVWTWLRFLVGSWAFRIPMPGFHTRYYLTGNGSSDSLIGMVRAATRSVAPEVLANRVQEIIRANVAAELRQCHMPILYLQAKHDRVVPPTQAQKVRMIQPNTTIVDIPGPHLLLQTEPVAAWKSICDFLTAHGISKDSGRSASQSSVPMINKSDRYKTFNDLPKWLRDFVHEIRPSDAEQAIFHRIPALDYQSLVFWMNQGDEGEAKVREYMGRVLGKFF